MLTNVRDTSLLSYDKVKVSSANNLHVALVEKIIRDFGVVGCADFQIAIVLYTRHNIIIPPGSVSARRNDVHKKVPLVCAGYIRNPNTKKTVRLWRIK